ncbi:hypothetical protein [Bradyrhizobium sp. CB3481]|uniref:hypothetical protein n=1 Tax=Bradyrhizobium sp. CB3481 TaxID=3039158 RepID=UPI0024B21D10|nr:hypothetical protein [Bradyrhizobium sp. CB3481]WFU15657.1 hypothetical protein QA643_32510 [Bradyrhizobium sp. CB3481]
MLPGFRFLFTAIVLSMSVLVFGLGAAALLRAAHEEFANLPARRTAPEPMFARRTDDQPPTLALLRIETLDDDKPAENAPVAVPETVPAASAPVAPTADIAAIEPEKLVAVKTPEPMQAEAANPDTPAKETTVETPPTPSAPTVVEAPAPSQAPAADVKVAVLVETPQPAVAPAPPPPAPDIYSFEGNPAATRIATLGGPAVIVDEEAAAKASGKTEATPPETKATEAKATEAKPDRSAAKKRAAEQAQERRRIAARRARLAREAALAQQQANPFIQTPFAQGPVARATR